MTPKFYKLKVKELIHETDEAVSILFDVPQDLKDEFQFLAGQNLTIKESIQGEELRRSYSLCTAPYEGQFKVVVKQITDGLFSTYANQKLNIGDELEVMTPVGNFVVHTKATHQKSYVLFAAGSGITPIMSILKQILHDEPQSDVTLFYGNKNFNSIIFREEIEALKNTHMSRLRVIHVLSRESLGNKIQKGRIDETKCENLYEAFLKNTSVSEVFVCGPETMILAVRDTFQKLKFPEDKVHFELFTTGEVTSVKDTYSGPDVNANVQVIIDGDTIDINLDSSGTTILEAAQEAGSDLPYACKGGVCSTCKAKVIEGTAHMDVNYALEKDELEAGYILTCQAHPTSDKLIVSFDD